MSKKVFDAVGLSFALRLINMALGILITPLLFRMMGNESLAGWFIVVNNIPFLGLLDFGLSPTLSRRIALIYGRLTVAKNEKRITYLDRRMQEMFSTGKKLFEARSWLALGISLVAGWFYLQTIKLSPEVKSQVLIGWVIVAVSQAIQIRGSIWSSFLSNTGNVALDVTLTIITSTLDLALRFVAVLVGGGIIGLAAVAGVFIIVRRMLSAHYARKRLSRWVDGPNRFSKIMVMSMIRPMASAWLVGVGAFLLLRTDQYFIVGTLDPKLLPAYQGTYQIFASLSQIALITSGAAGVFLSHYWAAGRYESFRNAVNLSMKVAMAIMWFGAATLIAIGASFFRLWLAGNFVGYGLLMAFSLTMIVETQTNILLNADRATEHEVYGRWLILCGLANIAITWVLSKYFGLLGIAISTALAVIVTTGWFSALNADRRLGISFFRIVLPIQLITVALSGCIFAVIKGIQFWVGPSHASAQVDMALGFVIGPGALAAWTWFGIFTHRERSAVMKYGLELSARIGGLLKAR